MLVHPSEFRTFIQPEDRITGLALGSIKLRHNAYRNLAEYQAGIILISDIIETPHGYHFDISPSEYYQNIKDAVETYLTYDTETHTIDYQETIRYWCYILNSNWISKTVLEKIQSNDLTQPQFGDFSITLMEYMVSGTKKSDHHIRHPDFIATPSS